MNGIARVVTHIGIYTKFVLNIRIIIKSISYYINLNHHKCRHQGCVGMRLCMYMSRRLPNELTVCLYTHHIVQNK